MAPRHGFEPRRNEPSADQPLAGFTILHISRILRKRSRSYSIRTASRRRATAIPQNIARRDQIQARIFHENLIGRVLGERPVEIEHAPLTQLHHPVREGCLISLSPLQRSSLG